jgi:hypothetical protein
MDRDDDEMDLGRLFASMRPSKADMARSAAILESVQPSSHLPTVGSYFRMRFALTGDRSWMEVIWKCLAHQDHAVVGKAVHGGYMHDNPIRTFIVGDVNFYDATELWAAIEADKAGATS